MAEEIGVGKQRKFKKNDNDAQSDLLDGFQKFFSRTHISFHPV